MLPCLATLLQMAPAKAQQERDDSQIQLGGIPLRLGMVQEDVLRTLTSAYKATHVETSPGLWGVTTKNGPPFQLVGSVTFLNGRLIQVVKAWGPGPGDQSSHALATALLQALGSATEQGRVCIITVEKEGPFPATLMQCGRRTIEVRAPSDSSYTTSVSEILR